MKEIDWVLMCKIERDICFLYHELSQWAGITGDLAFSQLYNLPYWEFLNLGGLNIPDCELCFIRDGCLVMILAMANDLIDGSGWYIKDKIGLCRQAIGEVEAEDERTGKLIRVVSLALDMAEQERRSNQEFEELSVWVNYEYVYGYFRRAADWSHDEHERLGSIRRQRADQGL